MMRATPRGSRISRAISHAERSRSSPKCSSCAATWKTLSALVYTIGLPLAMCSGPSRSITSVPDAGSLQRYPGTPVRRTNSSSTSAEKPSGKVGNPSSRTTPTISQCPVVVSLPHERSAQRPKHASGSAGRGRESTPGTQPSPSSIKRGAFSPPVASTRWSRVWAPAS